MSGVRIRPRKGPPLVPCVVAPIERTAISGRSCEAGAEGGSGATEVGVVIDKKLGNGGSIKRVGDVWIDRNGGVFRRVSAIVADDVVAEHDILRIGGEKVIPP